MSSGSSFSSLSNYFSCSPLHRCEDSASEDPKLVWKTVSSSMLLLSSDFFKPFKSDLPARFAHPRSIGHLQSSISSMSDWCFKLLNGLAFQNPFLKSFTSLYSNFHAFFQIRCRDFRRPNSISNHSFAAVLPGDSVAGIVVSNGIMNFLNIYNTMLVIRLVLTWFPNSPQAIVTPLSTLCDPYLNIFRGLIPPLGGTLDFSPILAFLVLNAFTSAAAALPAELPPELRTTGVSEKGLRHTMVSGGTASQKKWMRRLIGDKAKASGGVH